MRPCYLFFTFRIIEKEIHPSVNLALNVACNSNIFSVKQQLNPKFNNFYKEKKEKKRRKVFDLQKNLNFVQFYKYLSLPQYCISLFIEIFDVKDLYSMKYFIILYIKLTAAAVLNMKTGEYATMTGIRVAKLAWLSDFEHESLRRVTALVTALTGMNATFSEPWQVRRRRR